MGDRSDLVSVIWFDADEAAMTERILARAAHSGRNDDNIETLKKRFVSFNNEQLPIIMKFAKAGKVVKINALQTVEAVFEDVKGALRNFNI